MRLLKGGNVLFFTIFMYVFVVNDLNAPITLPTVGASLVGALNLVDALDVDVFYHAFQLYLPYQGYP